jgi:hypothetical protein
LKRQATGVTLRKFAQVVESMRQLRLCAPDVPDNDLVSIAYVAAFPSISALVSPLRLETGHSILNRLVPELIRKQHADHVLDSKMMPARYGSSFNTYSGFVS